MTEQTKIPLPKDDDAPSLFERASGAFGLDPFRAAPVPAHLKAASQPVPPAAPRAPEPMAIAPEPIAPVPKAAPTTAADTFSPSATPEPVRFAGTPHPIDRERLRGLGMIVPEAGATALLEEFRIVKRQLLASAEAAGDDVSRRILVCSPLPGDGKTFCAVNLAIAMAGEKGGEVLLIDADFGKPSVLSTLGLPTGPGLMDALADPALRIEDLVMATDIPGLFVLASGSQTHADSEWLASARTGELLDRLTHGAPQRMIVFDSPPALAASPAADLARHVGQAVLVARAEKTGRNALEDAVQLLGACPDIKLLLNGSHFSPSGRRFGTYYGYGE